MRSRPVGRRPGWLLLVVAAVVVAAGVVATSARAQPVPDAADRFDAAWRLVEQRYWNLDDRPVDWDAARATYRPQALAADDPAGFYRAIEAMYDELADDHSIFVPPDRVEAMRREFGDLPCLGVFGQAGDGSPAPSGVRRELLEGDVGYVAVPLLVGGGVAADVRRAVEGLERQGARAFVLDLRGNPGGRLVTMMQVAGVFTRGLLWRALTNWTLPIPYPALGVPATDAPLAVLIDGGVNSAAEGLAGALQQRGRATIVGERSAGNVEAVLPFCLRDGSQAWIATGVLAPIGAPTWEGRGVLPDVPVPASDALDAALAWLREAEARP